MKRAGRFILFLAALHHLAAQQPAVQWPVHLIDKPFHVGDTESKEMRSHRPDGAAFVARFELPAAMRPSIATPFYITIRVGDLIPGNDKKYAEAFKRGQMLTRLYINGAEVAVLNKLVREPQSVANIQKIQVRVAGTAFHSGSNELEIRPGAAANDLDDLELHEVVVSSTSQ